MLSETGRPLRLSPWLAGLVHSLNTQIQCLVRGDSPSAEEVAESPTLIRFLPIVALALVFNLSNLLGFSYADRAQQRQWASSIAAHGNLLGFGAGGIGGQLMGSVLRGGLGRVFG